jgi:branched-chain amino acid transport system permease protein
MSSVARRVGLLGIIALVAVGVPFLVSGYQTVNLTNVLVFTVAILGLNILTGYSGQISLGHGAFLAVGAFVPAVLLERFTAMPWWLTIPVAGVVGGLIGAAIGVPALRLEGIYLALATFALGVAAPIVLLKWASLTGGIRGILINPITSPVDFLTDEQFMYFCCLVTAALLFLIAWNVLRGRTGRAFRAIRDGELAARAFGIDLPAYKTLVFAISAGYACIAGALYGLVTGYVQATQFQFQFSVVILIGAIVGGIATLEGAVLGGLFAWYLPVVSQQLPINKSIADAAPAVTQGVILLIVMFVARQGVAGLIRRGYYELRDRLVPAEAA